MPFAVPDPEFKGRVFYSVAEYSLAKEALSKRMDGGDMRSIYLDEEPKELRVEAEVKRATTRLAGVEVELRNFRETLEEIKESLKILLINKDGIPYLTKLKAVSTVKGEFPEGKDFELVVTTKGYEINGQCYNSLSAAAEGVSGNRRNGWEWWKTETGTTAREAFRL